MSELATVSIALVTVKGPSVKCAGLDTMATQPKAYHVCHVNVQHQLTALVQHAPSILQLMDQCVITVPWDTLENTVNSAWMDSLGIQL